VRGGGRPIRTFILVRELADFCITSIQGAMLLGKIRRDRRTVDLAIGQVLAHLSTFRRS